MPSARPPPSALRCGCAAAAARTSTAGPAGTLLDTRGWRGIVEYDPAELVVTARCGTPLAELEAALAEKRQMLAFEPPHLDAGAGLATVGGAVAAGLSGPRRQSVGALRDFVLGAQLMDGRGEVLNFGGRDEERGRL